jgi:hypothetical protein
MPEYQSLLRVEKTKDGGALATLFVNGPEGPVKFTAQAGEKDLLSIDKAFHRDLGVPLPSGVKMSGEMQIKRNDAIMGAALRKLSEKIPPFYAPSLAKAAENALIRKTKDAAASGKARGATSGDTFRFYDDEEHCTMDELNRYVGPPLGVPEAHSPAGIVSGMIESVEISGYGADLISRKHAMSRVKQPVVSGEGTVTPASWDVAAAKGAVIDIFNRKRPGELKAIKYEGLTDDGKMRFIVKTKIPGAKDETYNVSSSPVGFAVFKDVTETVSGDEGRPANPAEVREAQDALSEMCQRNGIDCHHVTYQGTDIDGDLKFAVQTSSGLKNFKMSKEAAGWQAVTVSGDDETLLPPTPGDIDDARRALMKLCQKDGCKGISYQGVSPIGGGLKFLVKTDKGIQGYEMSKQPVGWQAIAMSGDEVGLFGFLKKAVSDIESGVKKVGKGTYGLAKAGTKDIYKAGKFVATKAEQAALYPVKRIIWSHINSKGIPQLAQQRANYVISQQTHGQRKVATPAEVKTIGVPYATAYFKKRVPSVLSGEDVFPPKTIIRVRKLPLRNKHGAVVGSYGRVDFIAIGDRPPGEVSMDGTGNLPGRPRLIKSFVIGASAKAIALDIAPIVVAPIIWVTALIKRALHNNPEAPATTACCTTACQTGPDATPTCSTCTTAPTCTAATCTACCTTATCCSTSADNMSGATRPKKKRLSPQQKVAFKKLAGTVLGAVNKAGISTTPKGRWPRPTVIKAFKTAEIIGGNDGKKMLYRYAAVAGIALQTSNGKYVRARRKKASSSYMGGSTGALGIASNALSSAGIPLTTNSQWTRSNYVSAINIVTQAISAQKSSLSTSDQKKNPNSLGRAMVKTIVRNQHLHVQDASGNYFVITGSNLAWMTDQSIPPDFTNKKRIVKQAFVASRNAHHQALVSQNNQDQNYVSSIPMAMSDLQAAGLPTDQIHLGPTGTLLAGDTTGAFDTWQSERRSFLKEGDFKDPNIEEQNMFNVDMWLDPDDENKDADDELTQEQEKDIDTYGTDQEDLWMRPNVVAGTRVGQTAPMTTYAQAWYQPISFFQNKLATIQQNLTSLTASTAASAAAAQAAGGGGGGGGGGQSCCSDGGGGGGACCACSSACCQATCCATTPEQAPS